MPVPILEEIAPEPDTAPVIATETTSETTASIPEEDTSTTTDYTVERGDNLWKIAREFYGLESPADIQRAVDHIASLNGLGEGTDANNIKTGQVLQLPDSPVTPESTPRLDWAALDRDSGISITSTFAMAVRNESPSAAVQADNEPRRPVARPDNLAPAA